MTTRPAVGWLVGILAYFGLAAWASRTASAWCSGSQGQSALVCLGVLVALLAPAVRFLAVTVWPRREAVRTRCAAQERTQLLGLGLMTVGVLIENFGSVALVATAGCITGALATFLWMILRAYPTAERG